MNPAADLEALAGRYGLGSGAPARLEALIEALDSEPDPHTTIRGRQEVIDRHLADSLEGLAVDGLRQARTIADIGAGAGFPGLALAIALPASAVDLVESQRRKCAVIDRLAAAARASNARSVCARAEDWASGGGRERYDAATARAVASLPVVVEYAAPLLRTGGVLVAWKGRRDRDEERRGREAARLAGVEAVDVIATAPFRESRRHLHLYAKVKDPQRRLPRRPGQATKHPLA